MRLTLIPAVMAPSCDHQRLYCVHSSAWPSQSILDNPGGLSWLCREHEEGCERTKAMIEQHCTQIEALSENETEYDQEEAENLMNNAPSPDQRLYCYWNPEYEAQDKPVRDCGHRP